MQLSLVYNFNTCTLLLLQYDILEFKSCGSIPSCIFIKLSIGCDIKNLQYVPMLLSVNTVIHSPTTRYSIELLTFLDLVTGRCGKNNG